MLCPKCRGKFFKQSDDDRICMNCGTLIIAELEPSEINFHEKCCVPLPTPPAVVRDLRSPVVRRELCTAYMKETFNTIAEELIKLKSWNQIHLMLAGRESCRDYKALRKYYQRELAERMATI